MTVTCQMRSIGKPGFGLLLALLLWPARAANAADRECLGTWRFDLARPEPASEAWLSPESFCRARTLPRTLTVEVRPADGRASITGSPLQPTDVLFGGGHCEFRFSQIHDALPKNHELSIEVNDTGTVVRGTARCSERTPTPSGESTGISISLAVTGGRLAGDNAAASGPQGQVAAVVAACRQHDADALWRMLTPRFRAEVDQQAIQLRSSLPAAELRRLYGHSGRPQAFNGLAFLRHTVRTPNSPDNPCSGAESWKLGPGVTSPDGFLVTVEHSENFGFALRFTKKDGGWQLDQISKSIALPKR